MCTAMPLRTTFTIGCLMFGIAMCVAPLLAADEARWEYVRVEPVYETGFDEPLVELDFSLPATGDTKEVVVVRLMQREGEITQSSLVPGSHPYVSEGYLLDRRPGGCSSVAPYRNHLASGADRMPMVDTPGWFRSTDCTRTAAQHDQHVAILTD